VKGRDDEKNADRLEVERSLRVNEERYRTILDGIADGYYEVDLAGNLTFFNDAVCRILGYSRDELTGMNNRRFMPEEDAKKVFQAFNRVYRSGRPDRGVDWRLIRKDGSSIYIESSVSLIRDGEGRPAGFRGIFRDINERKRAEKALRKSEERYRTILDSIEDGYYEVDLAGNLTFFNDAMCRLTGYGRGELTGLNSLRLMEAAIVGEVSRFFNRVFETGRADKGFAWTLLRKDGVPIQIEASVSLMRDETGRGVGFRGIVRDVTARARIEEELRRHRDHLEDLVEERAREVLAANERLLREVEERRRAEEELRVSKEEYRDLYESSRQREEVYRSLLHSSADAIVLYDLEDRVQYVSPSFTRTFGWDPEEVRGRTVPFVPESEQDRTRAIVRVLKERGTAFQGFETKRSTKDGRILDVSISTSRYNDHRGRPAGILVVLRDVTETRKLQAQLQHAQKMESIGTIASGVAHNFRNILAGISVNSQLLQLRHGESPELAEISTRLGRYVTRGSQLVEGLMQFARKPRDDRFRVVDLVEILEETHELARQSFDRKIELRLELPRTLPVLGDDPALRQVFMNLCTNARDAMPEGGILRLRAEREEERIVVEISDSGTGMDPETRKNCFDPFFTTKEVNAGTGLGLSTSYGIVKNHGGSIRVQSAPGEGTTFQVILPQAGVEPEAAHDHARTITVKGEGRRVLVVDDEEGMACGLEDLLESLGFDTLSATNGRDAIESFRKDRPDLVILDRNMPGMDGVACMEHMLAADPAARVVLVSGYDRDGPHGIDRRTRRAIAGYLTKPIEMSELGRLLEKLFEDPASSDER
jgi:PAS domain S-box-containing protein